MIKVLIMKIKKVLVTLNWYKLLAGEDSNEVLGGSKN